MEKSGDFSKQNRMRFSRHSARPDYRRKPPAKQAARAPVRAAVHGV